MTGLWNTFSDITVVVATRGRDGGTWLAEWIWDKVIWLADGIWKGVTLLTVGVWNGVTWLADGV